MTIYVERDTNLIWEAQLFETFAMVRLATPGYAQSLKRISLIEFGRDFDECWADPDRIYPDTEEQTLGDSLKEKAPKGA